MFLLLSSVLLLLGVQQVAGQTIEDCPPVASLQCVNDASGCDGINMKQAFIRLNNGTVICRGCRVCVRNYGTSCPRFACPMLHLPQDCVLRSYSQEVLIGHKLCPVCETYWCTNM